MNRLLIAAERAPEYQALVLERALADLEVFTAENSQLARSHITQSNIVLGAPALVAPLLGSASRLEWVQSTHAGIDPFCEPGLRRDYALTGVKNVFGPLMSEYVFGHILALERDILVARQRQRNRQWQSIPYRSLRGLTLGICGLGSIGRSLAATANHFQMRVVGLSRSGAPLAGVDAVYKTHEICEVAAQADYLAVVLPATKDTRELINSQVLSALGEQGVLINVGRGAVVDEDALVSAIESRMIRGAVLDVFAQEPLSEESALWGYENVVITPHNAATTFPEDIVGLFAENYQRFLAGKPLIHTVDLDRGY